MYQLWRWLRLSSNTGRSDAALPAWDDAEKDVRSLIWSANLAVIKRFHHQPFWDEEGQASDRAAALEGEPRLESVADHSWKVADAVLVLSDHFDWLDRCRLLELAILHDKLEILTGDLSPIDADASGQSTHAFNAQRAAAKRADEFEALERYEEIFRPPVSHRHAVLFHELISESSEEARFVKAVDKLASLIFVVQAKRGPFDPRHVEFTVAYAAKAVEHFPPLCVHHDVLVKVFLRSAQDRSRTPRSYRAEQAKHRAIR